MTRGTINRNVSKKTPSGLVPIMTGKAVQLKLKAAGHCELCGLYLNKGMMVGSVRVPLRGKFIVCPVCYAKLLHTVGR